MQHSNEVDRSAVNMLRNGIPPERDLNEATVEALLQSVASSPPVIEKASGVIRTTMQTIVSRVPRAADVIRVLDGEAVELPLHAVADDSQTPQRILEPRELVGE